MLSKTASEAIRAVALLARLPAGRYVGAASIASQVGAPRNYLGKVLRQLCQEGLLVSQKGLRGGFRLGRDPAAISLFDVVDPIENLSRWSTCVLSRGSCSENEPCRLHRGFSRVREDYLALLQLTTVADVVAGPGAPARRRG
jgi:Rrf2 family protein